METPKEYHYVYYSYEEWGRGYFGSRTCKCLPEEDVKYFGSFKDKTFKPTRKIILKDNYITRKEAYDDEIILHQYYKVVENLHFANRSYQTSTKFYCKPSYGEKAPMYGKIHSKKTKIKISEAMKGKNNPMYGKLPHNYGKSHSEETRKKLSEKNKGENNPNYGKSPSEETKRKKNKIMKNKKWWNDGCGNTKFVVECPGDGWVLGRK